MKELVDSTVILNDTEMLLERMRKDGYLYFRHLIDSERVGDVRDRVLNLLNTHRWLDASAPQAEAKCGTEAPTPGPDPRFAALHHAIQSLETFHLLPHAENVLELLGRLLGGKVFVHPRKISRVTLPKAQTDTVPVHQDYTYIGGTVNFLSAWIPLKDCVVSNGALRILRGSHADGLVHCERIDRHPCGVIHIPDEHPEWHCTDYRAGDIVLFPATTIHGATHNSLPTIRLAMDVRYQCIDDEIAIWQTKPPFLPYTPEDWNEYTGTWRNRNLVAVPSRVRVLHIPETLPQALPERYNSRFF